MDDDDVRGPDQPEPGGKTDQQIFDEQIARASGKSVVMVGGVGILAALVLSTIALVISAGENTTTVTVPAAAGSQADRRRPGSPPAHGRRARRAALHRGEARRRRHRLRVVPHDEGRGYQRDGRPNLDKELTADPASATRESIVDPNKEIVSGYSANVMPTNYGTALTSAGARRARQLRLPQHQHQGQGQASLGKDHEHPVSDRHAGAVTRRTAGRRRQARSRTTTSCGLGSRP